MARNKSTSAATGRNVNSALLAAGAAAALAAAAGYYLYGSKNAAKNRQYVAAQAKNIQKGVIARAKKVQKLDRKQVLAAVDAVAAGYERVRGINPSDVKAAVRELRGNWQKLAADMTKEMGGGRTSRGKAKSRRATRSR